MQENSKEKLPFSAGRRSFLGGVLATPLAYALPSIPEADAASLESHKRTIAKYLIQRVKDRSPRAYRHLRAKVFGSRNAVRLLQQESTMYTPSPREAQSLHHIALVQRLRKKLQNNEKGIFINVDTQRIYLMVKRRNSLNIMAAYKTSTSRAPSSNSSDSNGTPVGMQRVRGKRIGILGQIVAQEGVPIRLFTKIGKRVMVGSLRGDGRALNGTQTHRREHAAVITTALTINQARGIYIHGTNRVDILGQRDSGGCIRMSNVDVTHLAHYIKTEADVAIHDSRGNYKPPRRRNNQPKSSNGITWTF